MDSQTTGQVEKKSVQVDQKLSSETRKVPSGGSSSEQINDTVSLSQRGQAAVSQEVQDVKGGSVGSKLRKVDVMDNNQIVVKIVDSETQKVVRQIPKEEEVRLKQAIQENLDNMADSSGINQSLDVEI
jgi:flagellar protein FlaG